MRLLVTGGGGQLGRCLQDRLENSGLDFYAPAKDMLDITSENSLAAAIDEFGPDAVINAAAYTAVDKAEIEPGLAFMVNEGGPRNLARVCAERDIPLIHISTDYVFDGNASSPYMPDAPVAPRSVYGDSKLAGEKVVRSLCEKHIIIRTSWVFSEYGNNFVKTMLRLAKEKDGINVVADQFGCPTYAGDLASAIIGICSQVSSGNKLWGVYHYCGNEATNWCEFSRYIINTGFSTRVLSRSISVNPITTEQYPTPAKRPKYSVLDCSSMVDVWSVELSAWRDSVHDVILKMK